MAKKVNAAPKRSVGKTRNAVQVIDACIKDIEDGYWICADLVRDGKGKKPMGCALGLVGINAGLAELSFNDAGVCTARLPYPTDGLIKWTTNASTAMKALSKTARVSKATRTGFVKAAKGDAAAGYFVDPELGANQNIITTYNDRGAGAGRLTEKRAIAWFNRARKALTEGKVS